MVLFFLLLRGGVYFPTTYIGLTKWLSLASETLAKTIQAQEWQTFRCWCLPSGCFKPWDPTSTSLTAWRVRGHRKGACCPREEPANLQEHEWGHSRVIQLPAEPPADPRHMSEPSSDQSRQSTPEKEPSPCTESYTFYRSGYYFYPPSSVIVLLGSKC